MLMVSNSRKKNSDQKNTASVAKKLVYSSRIKNIEKCAFIIRKYGFHFKKHLKNWKKNWCTLAGIWFVFKIFSISRKKTWNKK